MIPTALRDAIHRRFGAPLAWLQQGRSPVARLEQGILRVGPNVEQEHTRRERFRSVFPDLPETLQLDPPFLLETDLGTPIAAPLSVVDRLHHHLPPPEIVPLSGTLRDLLRQLPPQGGVNPTHLIRALRHQKRDGHPLPFTLNRIDLRRVFETPLQDIEVSVGWSHGALRAERVLQRGVCHWRHAGPRQHREADLAPFLPTADASPGTLLHQIKQRWRRDPIAVAEALVALGVINAPPRQATLQLVSAHPGLKRADLAAVLGCPFDAPVPAHRVARALGRARGLIVAGQPLEVSATPQIRPRPDARFRQIRGRDPRRLFSRWGEGVRLDEDPEARASLTPEDAAMHTARELSVEGDVVVDAFCGAGGNAIAFARAGARLVITTDTDRRRLEMARHNAKIYGVDDRIRFVLGDVFALDLNGDVGFFDPPWSGGVKLMERCWAVGRERFGRGGLKVPRDYPAPPAAPVSIYTAPEGFPAFLVVWWDRSDAR